jgi:predicted GNAT family acetyltransferase
MKINVTDLDVTLTENFIRFCCVELNTYPDIITVKGRDEPLKDNALGLCHEINCEYKYLITIAKQNRSVTDIYTTLAKEMIQIKKFMSHDFVTETSEKIVKKYVDNLYNVV